MSNFEIRNNDPTPLHVFNPLWKNAELTAPGEVTYPRGQVLAFDAASGKYLITKSGTAAVAKAEAILAHEAVYAEAGDKTVRILISGEVYEDQLVWDGSDTIDTIPTVGFYASEKSFRVQLRDMGVIARPDQAIDELDNQ